MSEVYSVQDVHFHISKSNPPQLIVHAIGMTSTSGWTGGNLLPRQYVTPPSDGIQDFDFVGTPPTGIALQVLTPVGGDGEVILEDWMKGVRVHAKSNNMSVSLSTSERSVNAI
ncbi:MAG: hypothetical protein NXI27_30655 [Alphaproteobacteria bacterium]|nr:hypothetical protein [Alphaproteobacteria bacterium]